MYTGVGRSGGQGVNKSLSFPTSKVYAPHAFVNRCYLQARNIGHQWPV